MVQDFTERSLLILFPYAVFPWKAFAFVDEGNVANMAAPRRDSGKKLRNDPLRESYFLSSYFSNSGGVYSLVSLPCFSVSKDAHTASFLRVCDPDMRNHAFFGGPDLPKISKGIVLVRQRHRICLDSCSWAGHAGLVGPASANTGKGLV